jgi:hypothetical protein
VGNGDDLSYELSVPAVFGGGAAVKTQGRHAVEAFDAAGMDADTVGCDYVVAGGPDLLRGLVARSRFRWVSANVRDGSRPSEARRAGIPGGQRPARRLPRQAAALARCQRSTTMMQPVTRAVTSDRVAVPFVVHIGS